jgi:hypothetical protein
MLSHPFFGDQPAMARHCERLGLALPLVARPRAEIDPQQARRVIDAWLRQRDVFGAKLEIARAWEHAVIAGRPAVIDRMLGLAGIA